MMREGLSALLAMLLVANFSYAGSAHRVDSKDAKIRALAIPIGSLVNVRLNDNEKIRGRMGEVSDEGFVIQTVQRGKTDTRKIAFTDLKSFKSVGKSHIRRNILFGAGMLATALEVVQGL